MAGIWSDLIKEEHGRGRSNNDGAVRRDLVVTANDRRQAGRKRVERPRRTHSAQSFLFCRHCSRSCQAFLERGFFWGGFLMNFAFDFKVHKFSTLRFLQFSFLPRLLFGNHCCLLIWLTFLHIHFLFYLVHYLTPIAVSYICLTFLQFSFLPCSLFGS